MPRRENATPSMTTALTLGGLALAGVAAYAFSRSGSSSSSSKSSSDSPLVALYKRAMKHMRAVARTDLPGSVVTPLRTAKEFDTFRKAYLPGNTSATPDMALILVLGRRSTGEPSTIDAALEGTWQEGYTLPMLLQALRWMSRPEVKAAQFNPIVDALQEHCAMSRELWKSNPLLEEMKGKTTQLEIIPGTVRKVFNSLHSLKCGIVEHATLLSEGASEDARNIALDSEEDRVLQCGPFREQLIWNGDVSTAMMFDEEFGKAMPVDTVVNFFIENTPTPEAFGRLAAGSIWGIGSAPGQYIPESVAKTLWSGKIPERVSVDILDPRVCPLYFGK